MLEIIRAPGSHPGLPQVSLNQLIMAMKTFAIGEYARGGIIQVLTDHNSVTIRCKALHSKALLSSYQLMTDTPTSRWSIIAHLNELTSSYYTDKILAWIETRVKIA